MRQIDAFIEESIKCFECFINYIDDNIDEKGNISKEILQDALEGFCLNIQIANDMSMEASNKIEYR